MAAEKALIDYNPDIVDQKTIEDTITEVGYQVIHEKVSIQVGGMTCVNCAKTIEKALNAKEGVYNAVVNFATERVLVEYNPEQIGLAGIKKTIQDVGYEVVEQQKNCRRHRRQSPPTPHPTPKTPLSRQHRINYSYYGFDVAPNPCPWSKTTS